MITHFVRQLCRAGGIDRAVAYTILARCVGVVAAPIQLVLVATCLTAKEQGYYYTFGNVLGLSVFFELGFGSVLSTFASHERALLEWSPDGTLQGDRTAKARLASLFRFARRWYLVVALFILAGIGTAGWCFFSSRDTGTVVAWRIPWIAAVAVCAATALTGWLLSLLEGCGRVRQIRGVQLLQPFLAYPACWLVLLTGGALYAGPVFFGTGWVVAVTWLLLWNRRWIADLANWTDSQALVNWTELWPLQWRVAVSWLSGYFVFQLFNPMLFAMYGPEVAGRMGMTLSIAQSLGSVALAWVGTKAPRMGRLWATKDYAELNRLFGRLLLQSQVVLALGSLTIFSAVLWLNSSGNRYASRLLEPLPFAFILLVQFFNNAAMSQAIFLRCNKQDPFVFLSVAFGTVVLLSNWILGRAFGSVGMATGYLAASAVYCTAVTVVQITRRHYWQTGDPRLSECEFADSGTD